MKYVDSQTREQGLIMPSFYVFCV